MEFRQALCKTLTELMEKDPRICVLDADLAKPNGTFPLYEKFQDRCFNAGISEANMASVAAGLSAYGMIPFIVTFTPFASRRICDQIAVSIAYAKQKVIIIGTDPGITAELNGGTHMSFEDVSVLRAIPTMLIYDATDANQLAQALPQLIEYDGPVYVRIPRKTRPDVYKEDYEFKLGKADVVKKGKDVTIIATGTMVYESLVAAEELEKEGISAEVISVNTIKPLDEETILASVKKTNKAITCENHNVIGGLYSAVAEMLCRKYPMHLESIGVQDEFGQVGKYSDLLKAYNMTPEDIKKLVKNII
ncbi:MAG: transketolase family protein [Bacilli bacterium]|nr:transketolase family protein [Bacilli bacterium]